MRSLSHTFRALSEETRLEIIALLLAHGELCVCDAEGVLGASQSKASRHLRYLHAARLVEDHRDGLWVRYRLTSHPTHDQRLMLDTVRRLMTDERTAELEGRYWRWMEARQARCSPTRSARPGARLPDAATSSSTHGVAPASPA